MEREREKETQMRPNPSHFRHTTEHNTTQEKLNRALAKSTDLTFQEKKKKNFKSETKHRAEFHSLHDKHIMVYVLSVFP